MKLTPLQVHRSWLIRAALVLVITGLAEGVVAWWVERPIFWTTLIAASLPLSLSVFVTWPLLRNKQGT